MGKTTLDTFQRSFIILISLDLDINSDQGYAADQTNESLFAISKK